MRLGIPKEKTVKLFANSEESDQTPWSAASDLGLHCLVITLLRASQLQWVNSREVNPNPAEPRYTLSLQTV